MKSLHNRIRVIMIPDNHTYITELSSALKKNDVDVCLLPSFHFSTILNFIKIAILKLRGYNIIHIQWTYVFPFFFMMKFSVKLFKKLGYRVVWTVHDIHEASLESKLSSKERMLWMYNNSDYRFIHYNANLKILEETLDVRAENVEIIFHPVFTAYENSISKEEARKILSISLDKKVLLLFGKIRKYKGFEIFFKTLEKLDGEYLGLIVGKASHMDLLKKLKEKQLPNLTIIDKYIPDDKIQIYFNASDVVVLPYITITTSGVALLAYHFHKPVITTDIGGMPETVKDRETGLLIRPNDVDALVTAIKEIYTMNCKKMGENAYKLSKELTWDKLAENTIKIYKRVVS